MVQLARELTTDGWMFVLSDNISKGENGYCTQPVVTKAPHHENCKVDKPSAGNYHECI